MKTLRVGIASREGYRKRTIAIAKGEYVPSKDEPKVWFESVGTLSQVLSDQNRALLRLILQTHPESLNELAESSGRATSNLSRTLRKMEQYGLVRFEQGPNRQLVPRVNYSGVELELPFQVDASNRPGPLVDVDSQDEPGSQSALRSRHHSSRIHNLSSGHNVSTNIAEYVNLAKKMADLGCIYPESGLALLPLNFESAKSMAELRHASQTSTIRKLFLNNGLPLSEIVERSQRPPYVKNKSSALVLPIIYFSASLYSQNPTLVNIALNVVSNYVFETLRGVGMGREVKLEIVIEKTKGKEYRRISYSGPVDGLKALPDSIREASK